MSDNRALKMSNGASVSDWLGTAATAAKVAAMRLEDVPNADANLDGANLRWSVNVAIANLRQSISECENIIDRLAESDAA